MAMDGEEENITRLLNRATEKKCQDRALQNFTSCVPTLRDGELLKVQFYM